MIHISGLSWPMFIIMISYQIRIDKMHHFVRFVGATFWLICFFNFLSRMQAQKCKTPFCSVCSMKHNAIVLHARHRNITYESSNMWHRDLMTMMTMTTTCYIEIYRFAVYAGSLYHYIHILPARRSEHSKHSERRCKRWCGRGRVKPENPHAQDQTVGHNCFISIGKESCPTEIKARAEDPKQVDSETKSLWCHYALQSRESWWNTCARTQTYSCQDTGQA